MLNVNLRAKKMTVTFGKQPQGKFVYKKQSKIRWRYLEDHSTSCDPIFVCGSWDDNVRIIKATTGILIISVLIMVFKG